MLIIDGGKESVKAAIGNAKPIVLITAAKEFLQKGSKEALRSFMTEIGATIGGRGASMAQIEALQQTAQKLGRKVGTNDASIIGSAINNGASILTNDKRMYKFLNQIGIPFKTTNKMGAFNILITEIRCSNCNNHYEGKIQFKYGDTWQFEYRIGDTLQWGGNDIGKSGASNVKVYGILENDHCPLCKEGNLNDEFDIILKNDKIMGIQPLEDIRIYDDAEGNYCICK